MAAKLKRPPAGGRWRRPLAWCAVLLAVLWVHGWFGERLLEGLADWDTADAGPQRIEVAFVRELQPSVPPAVRPRPLPNPKPKRKAGPPAHAASRPAPDTPAEDADREVANAAEPAASAPDEVPLFVVAAEPPASQASAPDPAASQPANAAFEWPPSSRLSYAITGHYNGPVEGSARVQWIRAGNRYQVHLDTRVALIATRRMTSDGELTPQGLRPHRYDEETAMLFGAPRRVTVRFEDDRVVLNSGRAVPRPAGVQDTASQLVQLVWLFTTNPQQLQPGNRIELPLALPWRVDTWVFDVLDPETVQTPFGDIPTVHVKPRRPAQAGNVLTVECWFAPGLQYLPARIRVQQDSTTYLDLVLDKPPLQAVPPS